MSETAPETLGEAQVVREEEPGIDPEILERREQALAEVRKFGDPVLKSKAGPVSDFDETLTREAEHMVEVMRGSLGVGLAATQLGIMHRVLVFQAGRDAEPTALVNPSLEWLSKELETAEEGCLSLPGVVVDVERPLHARVSGQDLEGEPFTVEASGLEARVIQHEIDHLDGVLIIDRTVREQRTDALRALREGVPMRREEPEDGESSDNGDDPGEA